MNTPPTPLRAMRSVPEFAPRQRISATGIGAMVGFHLLVGYALVSGLARDAVQAVQKPFMASIVPEPVPPAPPPPPPPPPPPQKVVKVVERVKAAAPPPPPAAYVPPPDTAVAAAAPAIAAVQNAVPAPAPPVAPPVPREPPVERAAAPSPVPAPTARSEAGLACPGYQQALQTNLAGAYERVGVAGVVKVQFRVNGSAISDVTILSGPREYQRAVQAAVRRFQCQSDGAEATVVALDINFRPE